MNKREIILEYIKLFLYIAFACVAGTFLGNMLYEAVDTDPVVINIVIQDPEKAIKESEYQEEKIDVFEPEMAKQPITGDFDILLPSGYSSEELIYTLSDESRKGLIPYVDTLLEAEETYGVNAFYLMCKFGLESGWGRYMAAENNIGGWTNSDGTYRDFDSVEDCIMHVSRNLSTQYKNCVGTRLEDVCKMYSPTEGYSEKLIDIMKECQSKIESI